jgi:hypothetical protein
LADFILHSEVIGQLQSRKNQQFFELSFCSAAIPLIHWTIFIAPFDAAAR